MSEQTHTAASARQILETPFPPEAIRTRPGSHGQELSYVETHRYIARLNEAYNGSWSFEIAGHEIGQSEVFVIGKLRTADCVKMSFGSCNITRRKDNGEIVDLGDTMKGAASDALKKACSLLGLGLHLYGDFPATVGTRTESVPSNGNGHDKGNGDNDNGQSQSGNGNGNGNGMSTRLSSKQLSYILSLGKDQGMDRTAVNAMSLERYGRNLEFLTKSEASFFIGELQSA